MNCISIPFNQLNPSELFNDFLEKKLTLQPFFEGQPFSDRDLKKKADSFSFLGDRKKTVELLKKYNLQFGVNKTTIQQIERLENPRSLAVVTGQQVSIFGGPLYTIYKTLSVLHYANRWESLLERPIIPVFWLADEDHDFQEIANTGIFQQNEFKKLTWDLNLNNYPPAGRLPFNSDFDDLFKNLKKSLRDTDFSNWLWNNLEDCYPAPNAKIAFGKWFLKLFEEKGLILAGSDMKDIKKHQSLVLAQSVAKSEEHFTVLSDTNKHLKKAGYHQQVQVQKSNLFYLADEGIRSKIDTDNFEDWSVNGDVITTEKLINLIHENPEHFSPNVFLRPIMQDRLLPVLSYVAGPGEIAYYAQMKGFYNCFDQKMPLITPRFSATLVESSINRIMEKLPFTFSQYNQRIEDLESKFISGVDQKDIEKIFSDWKNSIQSLSDQMKNEIEDIDPTLVNSTGKAKATYFTELDKLKGKVYRSLKQQEEVQLNRISKIKTNLFPDNNLQEREVSFIYYLNKYGPNLLDEVIDRLEKEKPDTHKLICMS